MKPTLPAAALLLTLAVPVAAPADAAPAAAATASPKSVAAAYMHALGNQNAAAACRNISTASRNALTAGGDTCPEAYRKNVFPAMSQKDRKQARSARAISSSVHGSKATVKMKAGSRKGTVKLVREGGRWKVDFLS